MQVYVYSIKGVTPNTAIARDKMERGLKYG
jgi:hypothetical protein